MFVLVNVKPKLEATFSEVDFSIRLNWTFPGQWNGRYLITYSSNNSMSFDYFIMSKLFDPNFSIKFSRIYKHLSYREIKDKQSIIWTQTNWLKYRKTWTNVTVNAGKTPAASRIRTIKPTIIAG